MSIIYQPTEANFPEIIEVWEASVRATHHFLKEEDIQYYKPLILNEYLYAVDLYCIKNNGGHINAFIGLSADKIEMLFIHPAARGLGIGKQLLQYAIKERQIRKVDVNEQNEQAIGFYTHFGFEVIGRTDTDAAGKPYPVLAMELL